MSDLTDLYQELILDHGKSPRNMRELEHADHQAEGYNPLCGDRVTVFINLDDDTIEDVSFNGSACAICTASASMMTQRIKGESREHVETLFDDFRRMLAGDEDDGTDWEQRLGKLSALGGVRRYPMRVKCATLPWHTLKAALDDRGEPVTTE